MSNYKSTEVQNQKQTSSKFNICPIRYNNYDNHHHHNHRHAMPMTSIISTTSVHLNWIGLHKDLNNSSLK